MTSTPKKRHPTQSSVDNLTAESQPAEQARGGDLIFQVQASFGPPVNSAGSEPLNGPQLARRLLELGASGSEPGPQQLARLMLAMDERVSDGTKTAALLYEALAGAGRAAIAGGANPSQLSSALRAGLEAVDAELARRASPLERAPELAQLVRSAGYEDALAQELGDIFDLIGPDGRLDLRKGGRQPFERVMEEGTLWDGTLASRMMSNAGVGIRAYLDEPAVIISDLILYNSEQLVHLVELAEANGIKYLLLVCRDLSVQSRSVLILPAFQQRLWVAAVKLPDQLVDAGAMLEDLALLTGGRVLRQSQVRDLSQLQVEDLGRARRAWADLEGFGIIGGQGDTRTLRERVAGLRQQLEAVAEMEERRRLTDRLARLSNGAVILKIGAAEPAAIDARMEQTARAAELVRGALRSGSLPGGGAALLDCRAALAGQAAEQNSAARQAATILSAALAAPFHALAARAGQDAAALFDAVELGGAGCGYDRITRQVRDMRAAGIVDSAAVLRAAVQSAVGAAAALIENMPARNHE